MDKITYIGSTSAEQRQQHRRVLDKFAQAQIKYDQKMYKILITTNILVSACTILGMLTGGFVGFFAYIIFYT